MLNVVSGKKKRPPRLFVYGTEGVGKSTFASCAPSPIFIPTEDGIDQIDCDSFPDVNSLARVNECIDLLITQEHEYKTVVIDTLDRLEILAARAVCDRFGSASIEKVDGGFGRGYVYVQQEFLALMDKLNYLRDNRGMMTLFVGHAKVENFNDPESIKSQRFSPRLNKYTSTVVCEWCDAVMLATREHGANRGTDGGERVLRTIGSSTFVAKNRYGMPEILPLQFDAVIEYIKNVA